MTIVGPGVDKGLQGKSDALTDSFQVVDAQAKKAKGELEKERQNADNAKRQVQAKIDEVSAALALGKDKNKQDELNRTLERLQADMQELDQRLTNIDTAEKRINEEVGKAKQSLNQAGTDLKEVVIKDDPPGKPPKSEPDGGDSDSGSDDNSDPRTSSEGDGFDSEVGANDDQKEALAQGEEPTGGSNEVPEAESGQSESPPAEKPVSGESDSSDPPADGDVDPASGDDPPTESNESYNGPPDLGESEHSSPEGPNPKTSTEDEGVSSESDEGPSGESTSPAGDGSPADGQPAQSGSDESVPDEKPNRWMEALRNSDPKTDGFGEANENGVRQGPNKDSLKIGDETYFYPEGNKPNAYDSDGNPAENAKLFRVNEVKNGDATQAGMTEAVTVGKGGEIKNVEQFSGYTQKTADTPQQAVYGQYTKDGFKAGTGIAVEKQADGSYAALKGEAGQSYADGGHPEIANTSQVYRDWKANGTLPSDYTQKQVASNPGGGGQPSSEIDQPATRTSELSPKTASAGGGGAQQVESSQAGPQEFTQPHIDRAPGTTQPTKNINDYFRSVQSPNGAPEAVKPGATTNLAPQKATLSADGRALYSPVKGSDGRYYLPVNGRLQPVVNNQVRLIKGVGPGGTDIISPMVYQQTRPGYYQATCYW